MTGIPEDLEAITQDEFTFGAPLRCTYFGNAVYDPESNSVYGCKNGVWSTEGHTTRLQGVEYNEELDLYYIIHIDEFPFQDTTLSEYFEEYYGDLPIMSRIADATIIEVEGEEEDQVIWNLKEDIVEDLTTPQDYVVSNVYSKYAVAEMEI